MPVYQLIPKGDLALSGDSADALGNAAGGSHVLVQGIQHTRQQLSARLQFFVGEWFIDLRQGIPYYRDVFVKRPNSPLIRSLMRRVVLTTPAVLSCPRFDITLIDRVRRRAAMSFQAVCEGGTVVVKPGDDDFLLDLPAA